MLAHWCLSQNFGDCLTWWLVKQITGKAPQWCGPTDERRHLLGVGSILNHAGKSSVVWGSGFASMKDDASVADVRLVRGPISGWKLHRFGHKGLFALGDPALLCPRYREPRPKAHSLGVIYHYAAQSCYPLIDGALHIDVLDSVENVIDAITSCERIISSSLHGLIVADAYGIPAAWLDTPHVSGDGMKFADHMMAVGGLWPTPLRWEDIEDKSVGQIRDMIPAREMRFDADAILEAFPNELR